jgi:hypothetical protein
LNHVGRWSLFEKREIESLSRVLTARTLDGYRVRFKLAVNFTRLLSEAETEALAQRYAAAFQAAIEVELCEGRVPLSDFELHRLITERVQEVPPHRVRVNGVHLVDPGTNSSASMPAVRPAPSGAPGTSSTRRFRNPSEQPLSQVPVSPSLAAPSMSHRPASPVSGFVRAKPEPAGRSVTSFQRVIPQALTARSLQELATQLGHAARSAAATLLLVALLENEIQLRDPLAMLEGALDLATSEELVQEAQVAVMYVLHRALVDAGFAESEAIELVQATAERSVRSGAVPVPALSRYFATELPALEFHQTFCRLLGIGGTEAAERALVDFVNALMRDAAACAQQLRRSLRSPG